MTFLDGLTYNEIMNTCKSGETNESEFISSLVSSLVLSFQDRVKY